MRNDYSYGTTLYISSVGNKAGSYQTFVTLVPVEEIKESELLYGTLPQNDNEIVITKSIAEKIMSDKQTMGIYDIRAIIGKKRQLKD